VGAVDTEIAVVGAGVMGLATARALARAGRDVVVCEQFALGHDRGSSHGTSRIVRLSYPEARYVRLAQESFPLWRQLEQASGSTLLETHGTLDLGEWEANRDALDACAVPHEVLDASEIERRFGIRVEPDRQGLFQADGGIIRADAALAALAEGLSVHEHTRVEAVEETEDGVAVGGLRARAAVVTAGPWAPVLVGVDAVPTVETASFFELDESVPSVIDFTTGPHHAYALVSPGGGLKAGLHQSGPVADPDVPAAPDAQLSERTAEWVERRFPAAGARTRQETCLYTTRAGDEFLLERRGRVVVGSPCSGHGFKFAPALGARLAALALEALAA
jgi:sarcosine oxidase